METEEAAGVPPPVAFEEVHDGHVRKEGVNITFRNSAEGSNGGVIYAVRDGEDVNVVVEEGGSTTSNMDYDQSGSGYGMISYEEVLVMRRELEQTRNIVKRQITELEQANEMMEEQQNRISDLEEDKKKYEMGLEKCVQKGEAKGDQNERLKGRIEDLEKTVEHLKNVIKDKEEWLHQKELLLLQKDADHNIVKAMNISEVSTLKKLLDDEREKRVIAEMQVKMLLGSMEPVEYLESREKETRGKNTVDLPFPRSLPVATSSKAGNLNATGDDDDDDEVVIIDEVKKDSAANGEAAKIAYPRRHSDSESEKVDDLMNQKFFCKACGLVCTSNLNLMKHIKNTHGQPAPPGQPDKLQSNTSANSEETETRTTFSGPSCSQSPHNLRKRNPSNTTLINDIRRSSSSSASSSVSDNWSSDQKVANLKENGKFICNVCEERYPIVSRLKVHMRQAHGIEDDKFSIGCKDCGVIFNNRKAHVFHRRIAHGTKYNGRGRGRRPNAVTLPGPSGHPPSERRNDEPSVGVPEASSSTQSLKKHAVDTKRLHLGCFCICGLQFRTTSHIKIHMKLRNKRGHMSSQIPAPAQNLTNPAPGTEGETFDSKMVVDENGMRILTIQPPPSQPSGSQQHHRLVGKDPKSFRAKYHCTCGRIYYNRASFQVHAKSKNMGKIFKCAWCTMRFDLHGNLKNHVRTYHKAIYGNGKFACGNCAQTFDNSRQLSRHRRQECMSK